MVVDWHSDPVSSLASFHPRPVVLACDYPKTMNAPSHWMVRVPYMDDLWLLVLPRGYKIETEAGYISLGNTLLSCLLESRKLAYPV